MEVYRKTKRVLGTAILMTSITTLVTGCLGENGDYAGDVFMEPVMFDSGPLVWTITLGDINGDDKPDVLTANSLTTGSKGVSVMLNTTPVGSMIPTFGPLANFAAGPVTTQVALADFNDDDVLDIVTANSGNIGHGISVLMNRTVLGDETAVFTDPKFFRGGAITHLVSVGDLNADGKPDLVTGNAGTALGRNAVSVLLNITEPGAVEPDFTPATNYDGGGISEGLALGDINNDGKLDIVEGNTLGSSVTILLNQTADGALTPDFIGPTKFRVLLGTAVDLGDFNQDGRIDMVVASTFGGTYVLLNETEPGSFEPAFSKPTFYFTRGDVTEGVVVKDFDGDGLLDYAANNNNIFTLKFKRDGVAVYYNRTPEGADTPVFDGPYTYSPSPGANSIASADINGDGLPDIAVGMVDPGGKNGVGILMNTESE